MIWSLLFLSQLNPNPRVLLMTSSYASSDPTVSETLSDPAFTKGLVIVVPHVGINQIKKYISDTEYASSLRVFEDTDGIVDMAKGRFTNYVSVLGLANIPSTLRDSAVTIARASSLEGVSSVLQRLDDRTLVIITSDGTSISDEIQSNETSTKYFTYGVWNIFFHALILVFGVIWAMYHFATIDVQRKYAKPDE